MNQYFTKLKCINTATKWHAHYILIPSAQIHKHTGTQAHGTPTHQISSQNFIFWNKSNQFTTKAISISSDYDFITLHGHWTWFVVCNCGLWHQQNCLLWNMIENHLQISYISHLEFGINTNWEIRLILEFLDRKIYFYFLFQTNFMWEISEGIIKLIDYANDLAKKKWKMQIDDVRDGNLSGTSVIKQSDTIWIIDASFLVWIFQKIHEDISWAGFCRFCLSLSLSLFHQHNFASCHVLFWIIRKHFVDLSTSKSRLDHKWHSMFVFRWVDDNKKETE